MKQLLTTIVTLLCVTVYSQNLDTETLFTTGNHHTSLVNNKYRPLDINGDGVMDIFGGKSNGFEAFLGLADGGFSHEDVFTFDVEPFFFESGTFEFADLDNDGDKDVVFVGLGGELDGVNWYENTTGTDFVYREELVTEFAGFSSPRIHVRDLDNDGDDDFIMHESFGFDTDFYAFYNENGNIVNVSIFLDSDINFQQIFTLDYNQDGLQDIAGMQGRELYIYLQGNMSFGSAIKFDLGSLGEIIVADYDLDGEDDLYSKNGEELTWYPIKDGQLRAPVVVYTGERSDVRYFLYDHGNDGDMDIYHGKTQRDGLFLVENDEGTYNDPVLVSNVGSTIVDINLYDEEQNGQHRMLINGRFETLGLVNLTADTVYGFTDIVASESSLRIQQINSDIDSEVQLIGDSWVGYVDYVSGDYPKMTTILNSEEDVNDVVFGDIDGDGDTDMVMVYRAQQSSQQDTTIVWFSNESGVYSDARLILSDEFDVESVQVFDFDKDGDIDILGMTSIQSPFHFINDGTGKFSEDQLPAGRSNGSRLLDVDQDGFMDVLGWDFGGSLQYLRNDTEGSFERRIFLGSSDRCSYADGIDYDNDGDLDLIARFYDGANLRLFVNDAGTFTEQILLADYVGFAEGYSDEAGNRAGFLGTTPFSYYTINADFSLNETIIDAEIFVEEIAFGNIDGAGIDDMVLNVDKEILLVRDFSVETIAPFDCPGLMANFGDACDDGNPRTMNDEIQNDCACAGILTFDCPGLMANFGDPCDDGDDMSFGDMIDFTCDCISTDFDMDGDGIPASEDCNDSDPTIYPGAMEICDDIDQNCDGSPNDGLSFITQYADNDGDGYGVQNNVWIDCMLNLGWSLEKGDCDDTNPNIYPDAIDVPGNGVDENCDGIDGDQPIGFPLKTIGEVSTIDVDGNYNSNGLECTLRGVVHSDDFLFPRSLLFYILDDNRDGILVFGFDNDIGFTPVPGDEIQVSGRLSQFNGVLEMEPDLITVLNSGNSLFDAMSISELNEETEADVVKIENVTLVDPAEWRGDGSSYNVIFSDGNQAYPVRIYQNSFWSDKSAPLGQVNISGIGGQFDDEAPLFDGYQLAPRWMDDISFTNTTEELSASPIRLFPNPTNNVISIVSRQTFEQAVLLSIEGTAIATMRLDTEQSMNIESQPPGIYILELMQKNGNVVTKRIVKL